MPLPLAAVCSCLLGPRRTHSERYAGLRADRARPLSRHRRRLHCLPHRAGRQVLAGGRAIETPFGTLVAPNITPDQATGIGGWSNDKFYNAMHNGVGDAHLYPAMPYPSYTKVTRDDVMAIRAYLNTVQPVTNSVRVQPAAVSVQRSRQHDRLGRAVLHSRRMAGSHRTSPRNGIAAAIWSRASAHCGTCHTPKNALGGDENSQHLQGYALQGWFAPDITGDKRVGVGAWSVDDIVEYLKTGANRYTERVRPDGRGDRRFHLALDARRSARRGDLSAGSARAQPGTAARIAGAGSGDAGRRGDLCRRVCRLPHRWTAAASRGCFPSLKGSAFVQQSNPASLLQVVLDGTRAVATAEAPTGPAMPAFDWKLSDEQVAAVVTYIRNAWGNAAPPVSAAEVSSARNGVGE